MLTNSEQASFIKRWPNHSMMAIVFVIALFHLKWQICLRTRAAINSCYKQTGIKLQTYNLKIDAHLVVHWAVFLA